MHVDHSELILGVEIIYLVNPYKFVKRSGFLQAIFFASAQLQHDSSAHIDFNFHFDSDD